MNKKKLFIGIAVVLLIGGIVYFLVLRKKPEGQKRDTDDFTPPPQTEFPGGEINPEPANVGQVESEIEEVGVDDRLDWVYNKALAEYLQDLMQPSAYTKLKDWVDLIKKERAEDPNKWPTNSGLSGQFSDIGHALYQMGLWNNSVLNKFKEIQG
jgi:hypothetical protein